MIERGQIWWAAERPVLVVQADAFNRATLGSIVVAAITSNLALSEAPGNVLLRAEESGLPRDSVVNVSQVVTLDKRDLTARVGALSFVLQQRVDEGLRLVLAL